MTGKQKEGRKTKRNDGNKEGKEGLKMEGKIGNKE